MVQLHVRQSIKETDALVSQIAKNACIEPLAARILIRRGMDDAEKATTFLNAAVMHDPYAMDGMKEAVDLINRAKREKMPVTVYGDYDCDGTCAAAMLCLALTEAGISTEPYIPDRLSEGYGLNEQAIRKIAQRGGLLITVDCGITNLSEVDLAQNLGLQVIVTDHHQPLDTLPQCFCLNPPSGNYPFAQLCGAGIAFKLIEALFGRSTALRYADLAALATIADIVPLLDENRTIVKIGLTMLSNCQRMGLKALIGVCGYRSNELSAGQVSFGLAPRINAAGRMGDAKRAFRLFTTEDEAEAAQIAGELDRDNAKRQQQEQAILGEAVGILSKDIGGKRTAVVAKAGWPKGVIGIVASRIVEIYGRPAAVISISEDGICTGSARGIKSVHIFKALEDCRRFLIRYGGHRQAGGFSLRQEDLSGFMEAFEAHFQKTYTGAAFLESLDCDALIEPRQMTIGLAKTMEQLSPFGVGNPSPMFFLHNGVLEGLSKLGKTDEHLRVRITKDGQRTEGLLFRAKRLSLPAISSVCDFAGTLEADDFGGIERARYILYAIQPTIDKLYSAAAGYVGMFGYSFVRSAAENLVHVSLSQVDDSAARFPFGMLLAVHTPHALLRACEHWNSGTTCFSDVYFSASSYSPKMGNALTVAPQYIDNAYPLRYRIDTDEEMSEYAQELQLEREAMEKAYRALIRQAQRPMDMNERCNRAADTANLNPQSIGAALAVFEELGFFSLESMALMPAKSVIKRNLEDSLLYNAIIQRQGGERIGA